MLIELIQKERPGLLHRLSILTVGSGKGFVESGGILQLDFVDDHLAFKINIGAARKSQIEVSSNLLKLATDIIGD